MLDCSKSHLQLHNRSKGQARFYNLLVDGAENLDAAYYYPDPKPVAQSLKHHIAFWRDVEITE